MAAAPLVATAALTADLMAVQRRSVRWRPPPSAAPPRRVPAPQPLRGAALEAKGAGFGRRRAVGAGRPLWFWGGGAGGGVTTRHDTIRYDTTRHDTQTLPSCSAGHPGGVPAHGSGAPEARDPPSAPSTAPVPSVHRPAAPGAPTDPPAPSPVPPHPPAARSRGRAARSRRSSGPRRARGRARLSPSGRRRRRWGRGAERGEGARWGRGGGGSRSGEGPGPAPPAPIAMGEWTILERLLEAAVQQHSTMIGR